MENLIIQKTKMETKAPLYCGQKVKSGKAWLKDKFKTKRIVKVKILTEIDLTLVLLDENYSKHLGYRNLESLLLEIGLNESRANLYHAPALSKVFKFLNGEFYGTDPNLSKFYTNQLN